MGKIELKVQVDEVAAAKAEASGVDLTRIAQDAVDSAIASSKAAEATRWTDADRYRNLSDDEKAKRWAEDNAVALQAQRERIDTFGVFGEDLRSW